VKDNVAVAGVPMMIGSKLMEGYTPEFDATIITRVLDEGLYFFKINKYC
jgi:amidase